MLFRDGFLFPSLRFVPGGFGLELRLPVRCQCNGKKFWLPLGKGNPVSNACGKLVHQRTGNGCVLEFVCGMVCNLEYGLNA